MFDESSSEALVVNSSFAEVLPLPSCHPAVTRRTCIVSIVLLFVASILVERVVNALRDEEDHGCQHHHNGPRFTGLVFLFDFLGAEALLVHAFEVLWTVVVCHAGVSHLAPAYFAFETTIEQTAHFLVGLGQSGLTHDRSVPFEVTAVEGVVARDDAVFDIHALLVIVVKFTTFTGTLVVELALVVELLEAS